MMTREPDNDLEIRLSRALDASDPVPEHVLEAARAAIGWRTIDAELAELLHEDSKELAGVRGDETGPRHLTFAAGDVELELMLARDRDTRIDGQLVPRPRARAERSRPGPERSPPGLAIVNPRY